MPQLSLDLYVNILHLVPAGRDPYDAGPRILANCMQASSLLCEAACFPALWQPHYLARYVQSNEKDELFRRQRHDNNWRQMYFERRRLDALALRLLDNIISRRVCRYENTTTLARMGLDVWDALELEAKLSVPPLCRYQGSQDHESEQGIAPHALTRRFWAQSMAEIIMKRYGYEIFQKVRRGEVSFEETMSSMSCFFGVPLTRITDQLEELAVDCRQYLESQSIGLDAGDSSYSSATVCRGIIQFMLNQGFGPAFADEFQYRQILNNFPHAYLTTNRKTIPISLTHVFVAIARRVGIEASPVNFPNVVLAHVPSLRPDEETIYVNTFVSEAENSIVNWETNHPYPLLQVTGHHMDRHLAPATAEVMLLRASRNILAAARMALMRDAYLAHTAMCVPLSCHMLFEVHDRDLLAILHNMDVSPLECATFLLDKVKPTVLERFRTLLQEYCGQILEAEAEQAGVVKRRAPSTPVKYFVGLPFEHCRYSYFGCIVGWDDTCKMSDEWIRHMRVDALTRGRMQPFYNVLASDGSQRYVAEENITPIDVNQAMLSEFSNNNHTLPIYLEEAEIRYSEGNNQGRARFLLSPQSQLNYPDDDCVGSMWMETGKLPC